MRSVAFLEVESIMNDRMPYFGAFRGFLAPVSGMPSRRREGHFPMWFPGLAAFPPSETGLESSVAFFQTLDYDTERIF